MPLFTQIDNQTILNEIRLVLDRYARGLANESFAPNGVTSFLYISDAPAAAALPHLIDLGITHVINLSGCSNFFETRENIENEWARLAAKGLKGTEDPIADDAFSSTAAATSAGVFARLHQLHSLAPPSYEPPTYLAITIPDSPHAPLSAHLAQCIDFIDAARQRLGDQDPSDTSRSGARVLVHCAQGVSRSGAVVIAYIMKDRGVGFNEALAFVREARPMVSPNYGFVSQVMGFGRELARGKNEGAGRGRGRWMWKTSGRG